MKKPYKKRNTKFDPLEVQPLLEKAKAGDITARNELLHRFQSLAACLVHVCITGRPNYWSSYQKTFLKLFASKDTPLQNTASMLKTQLSQYDKEELFSIGQLAIMLAVDRCQTNFASTIVICFKDLIYKIIKDPDNGLTEELNYDTSYDETMERDLALELFLEELNEEEWMAAQNILAGNKVTHIPESLKIKFKHYLES